MSYSRWSQVRGRGAMLKVAKKIPHLANSLYIDPSSSLSFKDRGCIGNVKNTVTRGTGYLLWQVIFCAVFQGPPEPSTALHRRTRHSFRHHTRH